MNNKFSKSQKTSKQKFIKKSVQQDVSQNIDINLSKEISQSNSRDIAQNNGFYINQNRSHRYSIQNAGQAQQNIVTLPNELVINDSQNDSIIDNEELNKRKSCFLQLLHDFGFPGEKKIDEEDQDHQFQNYENKNLKYYKILLNQWILFHLIETLYVNITIHEQIYKIEGALQKAMILLYWVLWAIELILFIISLVKKHQWAYQINQNIISIRNILPIYDFELRRKYMSRVETQYLVALLVGQILATQIINNLTFHKNFSIPQTILTSLLSVFGICRIGDKVENDSKYFENLKNNYISLIQAIITSLVFLLWINYLMIFVKNENMKQINKKINLQQEVSCIMDNLNEVVITKSDSGVQFCNQKGIEIFKNIQNIIKQQKEQNKQFDQKAQNIIDDKFLENFHLQTQLFNSTNKRKTKISREIEDKLMDAKIFEVQDKLKKYNGLQQENKVHQYASASQITSKSDIVKHLSLNEIYEEDQKSLESKIFKMQYLHHEKDLQNKFQLNHKFVQIKKLRYKSNKRYLDLLQIIDISSEIMYDLATAEKKLLALINATVSHEMRNPINSMQSQIILQQQLNERINELIQDPQIQSIEELRQQLKIILAQYCESVNIQMSSQKILNFLVNDILDFAQLKEGKFRKNIQVFDIKESVEEIIQVQQFKADQLCIEISTQFINFEQNQLEVNQILKSDQMELKKICTDQQRMQQILLNLLSNALKFTKKGGKIEIISKLINRQEDFSFPDIVNTEQLFNDQQNRLLEIVVKDNGIGIRVEDQSKLFKLFGFLEVTKQINTKGIGLGLHICKKIAHFFGGEIVCDSQFGKGSSFIFYFALDSSPEKVQPFFRCQNQNKPQYLKILIKKNQIIQGQKKTNKEMILSHINQEIVKVEEEQIKHFSWNSSRLAIDDEECLKSINISLNEPLLQLQCQKVYSIQKNEISFQINNSNNKFQRNQEVVQENDQINSSININEIKSLNQFYIKQILESSPKFRINKEKFLTAEFKQQYQIDEKESMIQKRKILLVDDEPYNLIALKIMLNKCGIPEDLIDRAYNGQEAFDMVQKAFKLKQFSYGLIIMDCSMPIMDGYEATQLIRRFLRKKDIYQPMIVACTGHIEQEYIQKAWDSSIDEILPKPTNIQILNQIVSEIVEFVNE